MDAQSVAFDTFTAGDKRAINGFGILRLAMKTDRSRNSFQVFAAAKEQDDLVAAPQDSNNGRKKIVVLGSLNYDVFLTMDRLPEMGETLAAENAVFKAFGGKGAN